MNEAHLRICASPEWAAYVESELLPWALGDAELGDEVLEVGPGPGLTTDVLRQRVPRLTAVEIDDRWIPPAWPGGWPPPGSSARSWTCPATGSGSGPPCAASPLLARGGDPRRSAPGNDSREPPRLFAPAAFPETPRIQCASRAMATNWQVAPAQTKAWKTSW